MIQPAKPLRQLIVNADDFAMTEGVNRGILAAHERGIVTSTTLLATGEAFASAVAASKAYPRLGIGVHLNLSEGLPVSAPGKIPSLVDSQGRLHLTPGKLALAIGAGRVRSAELQAELRAQVSKVLDAGILPTHLDGHMHVHVLPLVSDAVIKIAHEFQIRAVRCPLEPIASLFRSHSEKDPNASPPSLSRESLTKRRLIAFAVSGIARRLRRQLKKAALFCPTRFYGIFATGYLDAQTIMQILHELPENGDVSELMCHPGYMDAALELTGGSLQRQRETELAALTSPGVVRGVSGQGIRLITYCGLSKSHTSPDSG